MVRPVYRHSSSIVGGFRPEGSPILGSARSERGTGSARGARAGRSIRGRNGRKVVHAYSGRMRLRTIFKILCPDRSSNRVINAIAVLWLVKGLCVCVTSYGARKYELGQVRAKISLCHNNNNNHVKTCFSSKPVLVGLKPLVTRKRASGWSLRKISTLDMVIQLIILWSTRWSWKVDNHD